MPPLISPSTLSERQVAASLAECFERPPASPIGETAGVILLIQDLQRQDRDPCILLNKRSSRVKQPGDLCCPGGQVQRALDAFFGWLLSVPGSPLMRSPGWSLGRRNGPIWRRYVRLYWACGLRESWEEMGLRPWRVSFSGVLPVYQLTLFRRKILPLVGWISTQERFRPNWEVERIVPIPLASFLNADNYGIYALQFPGQSPPSWNDGPNPFPCFVHHAADGREILWGATYHIVLSLLKRICGFTAPPLEGRPTIAGELASTYLTGDRHRG